MDRRLDPGDGATRLDAHFEEVIVDRAGDAAPFVARGPRER
jgi:hypothetical protein